MAPMAAQQRPRQYGILLSKNRSDQEPNRALYFDDPGRAFLLRTIYTSSSEAKSAFENAVALPYSGKPMFLPWKIKTISCIAPEF